MLAIVSKVFSVSILWYQGIDMLDCNGRQFLTIFLVPRQFQEIMSTDDYLGVPSI